MDLGSLRAVSLAAGHDRAFVDGVLRMSWARTHDARDRAHLRELAAEVADASLRAHEDLRGRIASGELRGRALQAVFDAAPAEGRDHFVEEVLGIAYPPFDEPSLERELVAYMPSTYEEIVYALDQSGIEEGEHFLDIGAGAGKAVLLAALLRGAASEGIDLDGELVAMGASAAASLGLTARARFVRSDARVADFGAPDVVFMYLPFTGSVLTGVLDRLLATPSSGARRLRGRVLCAGALDTVRYPSMTLACAPRSWLHVYAWGATSLK